MFVVMGAVGYFAAPPLLDLVNAAPAVKAQALPFLRINFVVQHRHVAVLHAVGGAARGRRRAHAASAGPDDDGAEHGPQHRADPRSGADSRAGHGRIGAGHRDRVRGRQRLRALPPVPRRLRDPLLAAHGLAARLDDHQVAVQFRPADRRAGHCDERRRASCCCASSARSSTARPRRRPTPSATPSSSR